MVAATDPVIAVVTRGPFVEALHHGSVAVVRPDGTALVLGDASSPMLARSALKPLQAVAMLDAGLDVDHELLALACASHSGEAFHREGALRMLAGAGLSADALLTTPGLPAEEAALAQWLSIGRGPAPLAHNCSGKHAAMLRTCVQAGWPTEDYLAVDHPLQCAIRARIAQLTGETIADPVIDGCGAPAFATSLTGLARAFGIIAGAPGGPERRVAEAIRAFPEFVSGSTRMEVRLHRDAAGQPNRVIAKVGAEGTLAAGLPDGTGVAVKASDGIMRAAMTAMIATLTALGYQTSAESDPVLGHGRVVGAVSAADTLTAELKKL